jgi:hypothetical protein
MSETSSVLPKSELFDIRLGSRAREMGELGVPDRYIDAFCGCVPKSVLARQYTDYSPERLKRIYDEATLRVLS